MREERCTWTAQGGEIVMGKGFAEEGREPEERTSREKGLRNGGWSH